MRRATDLNTWDDENSGPMKWDEKLFLAACAYLLLKGLLKPSEASDRRRVRYLWQRMRQDKLRQDVTPESRIP